MFWTPHVKIFNFDLPDRGGASDTVPSLYAWTITITRYTQSRTQGTVEIRPPLLDTKPSIVL